MDHLIIKYLSKEISLEERHQLSKWLEEDELNPKILEKYELYWTMSQHDFTSPKNEVLAKIESEIEQLEKKTSKTGKISLDRPIISYLKYAAVLIIVFFLSFLTHRYTTTESETPAISYVEKVSPPGKKITTLLPDGTTVKLNSGSKIIIPSHFSGKKREVVLFGEAFFDVKRDEEKPFVIKTADLEVEVLGTSFDVKAYSDGTTQQVAVRSGSVRVTSSTPNQVVHLRQNEMIRLSAGGKLSKSTDLDKDMVFGWMEQKLVFKDNSLMEVFKTIEKWYGIEIKVREASLSDKQYTAVFENNPSLDHVMGSISHVYKFKYELNEKILIIEK